jgi:hypothetical protein
VTRRHAVTAAALGAAAFVLYAARLEHTPIYLHDAEILFGLQAHALASTARDLSGRLLPLYFQMTPIGENVWFHPVIVYVTAAFLKTLPFAEWSVRLPSAAIGALDVALVYLLGLRLFGDDASGEGWALVAALLLALTPAHYIHSRIAMDYIYPLPFVLGWLLALSFYLERRQARLLFVATSLLGFGVYSYIASVIMMPIYLAMTLVVVWWAEATPNDSASPRMSVPSVSLRALRGGAFPTRRLTAAATGFVWPLLAIPLWLWRHPLVVAETLSRYHVGATATRYSGLAGRLSMYWYFNDPTYLFLTGGYANVVNSTRHAGVFALPLAVLLPAGIYRIVNGPRSVLQLLVMVGFFAAPIAACLAVPEPYAIDRELTVVVFGVLLASVGAEFLWTRGVRATRLATVALALVPLHFAFFAYDYFTDYRRHSAIWFELNHRGAFEAVVAEDARLPASRIYLPRDKDPYMESYWRFTLTKMGRLALRDKTELYSGAALAPAAIPSGALVVARRSEPVADRLTHAGLRVVATIPEIADPSEFEMLER